MGHNQLSLLDEYPDSTTFRPIHYLGNKVRALDAIEEMVDSVASPDSMVCDLFAGSGVVASRLARGHSVLANDIQEYSRVLTSAQLNPSPGIDDAFRDSLLDEITSTLDRLCTPAARAMLQAENEALEAALQGQVENLASIIELGSLEAQRFRVNAWNNVYEEFRQEANNSSCAVICRFYGGVYFSFRQALELDAIARVIRSLPSEVRDSTLAALLSTASEVVSTVGNHFAQPIKPRAKSGELKTSLLKRTARTRTRSTLDAFWKWLTEYANLAVSHHGHIVTRQDFRSCLLNLPSETAAIYADPPYTRDHYSRFYHVLETLALLDNPSLSRAYANGTEALSRAGYRADRHQSPFSIASQVRGAFQTLFEQAKRLRTPLIISYSPSNEGTVARPRPRLMTIEEIVTIGQANGFKLDVTSAGEIAHSKFNRRSVNSSQNYYAEVLLLAIPRG